jgi:hypothetical protein
MKSTAPMVARRLHIGGWLLKEWEPDKHPRTGTPPNPGWFAPTNSESNTGNTGFAQDSGSKPTSAGPEGGHEQQAAGLGGADNCTFDTETGDVYFNGEHIGNLGELSPI